MGQYDLVYDGRKQFVDRQAVQYSPQDANKIDMIKNFRILTGYGLYDAKIKVEQMISNPHKSYRVAVDPDNHNLQRSAMTVHQVLANLRDIGIVAHRVDERNEPEHRLKLDDQIENLAVRAINERAYDRARQLLAILEGT